MAKKKKNKKATAKQREKSEQKKQRKQKLKLTKPKRKPGFQFIDRQAFSDMEAPEGFRPIFMSQAIVEYGKPLGSLTETNDEADFNLELLDLVGRQG